MAERKGLAAKGAARKDEGQAKAVRSGAVRAADGGKRPVVREQEVSQVELFYDLIFVFAVSKMTEIFEGVPIDAHSMFYYFVSSFAVLQAWMYMTNYINRFGRVRWYDTAIIVVNMCAAVFMSDTIVSDWSQMFPEFNMSMFVLLGTVGVMYATHLRQGEQKRQMALFALRTIVPACAVYLAVSLTVGLIDPQAVLVLDTLAIAWGIFGPAIVNPGFELDLSLISFPHLTERFELITLITFGEAVVTVSDVFSAYGFSAASLMTFGVIVALFGCYEVQMHELVEHHQSRRGLRLIYSHFFILISVNLMTVCLNKLVEDPEPTLAVCAVSAAAVLVFFFCLMLLSDYHRADVHFTRADFGVVAALAVVGAALSFAGLVGGMPAFLAGPLLAGAGCFFFLLAHDKGRIHRAA